MRNVHHVKFSGRVGLHVYVTTWFSAVVVQSFVWPHGQSSNQCS